MSAVAHELALGRYRMGPLLGRGATSSVRQALDTATGRQVAVKTVPADPDLIARVRREVRAASRLDHPNVIRILDWGRDPDCVRLVWELVTGPSLREVLTEGPLDVHTAVTVAAQVLDALDHAHARGVVHRDVKPANVVIDGDGSARLADFGVARVSGEPALTMAGSLVGTVAYMAPEQARGEPAGPRADVYAACLMLYEALTGVNPIASDSPVEMARRAARGQIPPLGDARPDLPPRLVELVMAGLHPVAASRPAAGDLRDGLVHALRQSGYREGRPAGRVLTPRLRRAAPALLRAAGGAAVTAVGLSEWTGLRPEEVAVAAVAAGAALAMWPGLAIAGGVVAIAVLVGRGAPGLGVAVALVAAVLALTGARYRRLMPAPLGVAIAFAAGLGPAALALLALVPGWRARLWVAVTGVAGALTWQLLDGTEGLLLSATRSLPGADAAAGERDPLAAVRTVAAPLADHPWVAWQALALVVAGVAAGPALARMEGGARVAAAAVWVLAGAVACAAVSPDPTGVAALYVPSAILVLLWAVRPWSHLARMGGIPVSANLRGPLS